MMSHSRENSSRNQTLFALSSSSFFVPNAGGRFAPGTNIGSSDIYVKSGQSQSRKKIFSYSISSKVRLNNLFAK